MSQRGIAVGKSCCPVSYRCLWESSSSMLFRQVDEKLSSVNVSSEECCSVRWVSLYFHHHTYNLPLPTESPSYRARAPPFFIPFPRISNCLITPSFDKYMMNPFTRMALHCMDWVTLPTNQTEPSLTAEPQEAGWHPIHTPGSWNSFAWLTFLLMLPELTNPKHHD